MKPGLMPGVRAEVRAQVTENMTPIFDGVMVHAVYSTWSMVHHMELAARKVLAPYLEEHEEGLGTHVSVDHVAPARVGRTIRVVAECTDVTPKSVTCRVSAYDGERLLGRGTQVQTVLSKKTIENLIERS